MRAGTERYLVIEQKEGFFERTVATVCIKGNEIKILKRSRLASLGELILKRIGARFDKLVVSLDSSNALTIQDSVIVKPPSPLEIITEEELETLLHKALWEFLNRYRVLISRRLGVSDSSLVLNDAQVRRVRIDGHNLFNPVGFKGGEIEFVLRGTFVTNQWHHDIANLGLAARVSVIERESALASFLENEKFTLVAVDERKSVVFRRENIREVFSEEINWGIVRIKEEISKEFGVDYETAAALLDMWGKGLVSETIRRRFKKIVGKCLRELLRLTPGARREMVFYFTGFAIPPEAVSADGNINVLRCDEELARKGVVIGRGRNVDFDVLKDEDTAALLFHSYTDRRYEFLNVMLRRRAGWLVSNF